MKNLMADDNNKFNVLTYLFENLKLKEIFNIINNEVEFHNEENNEKIHIFI